MNASKWHGHLLAAEGYLELGMCAHAMKELEELDAQEGSRPEVCAIRLELAMATKNWTLGALQARHLVTMQPGDATWWINYAYCARRGESVEHAQRILNRAVKLHPREAMIRYNLGCYACILGDLAMAKDRLEEALALNEGIRELALTDEDLAPLRTFIAELRLPAIDE